MRAQRNLDLETRYSGVGRHGVGHQRQALRMGAKALVHYVLRLSKITATGPTLIKGSLKSKSHHFRVETYLVVHVEPFWVVVHRLGFECDAVHEAPGLCGDGGTRQVHEDTALKSHTVERVERERNLESARVRACDSVARGATTDLVEVFEQELLVDGVTAFDHGPA